MLSTDSNVTGYVVKWGTRSGNYTSGSIDVGNKTNWSVSGLTTDQKYFFVVTAKLGCRLRAVHQTKLAMMRSSCRPEAR